MRFLLTGSTGYIGSTVLRTLHEHGHEVVAVVRSDEAAAKATAAGADTVVIGALSDAGWFASQLAESDGAVHIAHLDDPADYDAVVEAASRAYGGTKKPFVATSGLWMYGDGDHITETSPLNPPALVAARLPREEQILAADYRGVIVMAPVVYGNGGGLFNVLAGPRTENGSVLLVGDGSQHWGTVHVEDLAELYVMALENGEATGRYLAASGVNPTVRELGEATGAPVQEETADDARARFGELFADALLLDQQADGARARSLGWAPTRRGPLEEITALAG